VSDLAERYRRGRQPSAAVDLDAALASLTRDGAPVPPASGSPPPQSRPEAHVPLATRLEQEIRAGRVELPVLPQVAGEVQQLVDRDADLPALVKVIEREPAMAAALVKYANSAMYAGLRDVTELQGAIMRLGLVAVKQAVLSLSAKAAFVSTDPREQKIFETLWLHSLTTAVAARRLAAFVAAAPETAFLAGLLHDIGRVVVLRGISSLRERDPNGFRVAEHTVSEFADALHCSIGEVLCREWNIPADLRGAITRHHEANLTEQKDTLAALTQVADLMAAKVGASLNPNAGIRLVDRPAFVLLGLDDVRVASLLVDLEDERQALEEIF
jgi:putative nucleotidyltransferase with HDIG domain